MNHKYEIENKVTWQGSSVTIKLDGVVVGKRKSKSRQYKFALVVTGNQEYELWNSELGIPYHAGQVKRYQAIVDDAPGARNGFILFDTDGKVNVMYLQTYYRGAIADGSVAKWLARHKAALAACERSVELLRSGPQPEFSRPFVASWHQTRKNVPVSVRASRKFFDIVEIPEV
jgi:hypothetical protein